MRNDKSAAWNALVKKHTDLVASNKIVGSSLIIASKHYTLQNHIGFTNKKTKNKTSANTIYHWGSITKTFTGIAIMQLVERKKIKLTDPIIKYVPELKNIYNPFKNTDKITIEQIMTHSAGFRNATWPWGGDKAWHPHEPAHWDQLVSMMPYTEVLFKPGSKYSYSNLAIIFLARVIEKVTKQSYQNYLQKNILTPLGLKNTYLNLTPKKLLKYRSHNYYVNNNNTLDNGPDLDTGITASNGGLNGSCEDMKSYMKFLLGISANKKVLKNETLQKMFSPVLFCNQTGELKEYIGLTFYIIKKGNKIFIGHTGSQKGFMCCMYINPNNNKGVFLAFNTLGINKSKPDTRKIMNTIRAKALSFISG